MNEIVISNFKLSGPTKYAIQNEAPAGYSYYRASGVISDERYTVVAIASDELVADWPQFENIMKLQLAKTAATSEHDNA